MPSHLEERLQRDRNRIRDKVVEMARLAENALKMSLQALTEQNRMLAYTVILRDRHIDEAEKELDRLCQEFLVRQLPAGEHLRFVYAVIKINNELERIGDYAESIARQYLTLSGLDPLPTFDKYIDIAHLSIPMLRNAIDSFVNQDVELAKATIHMETRERKVDAIRHRIHHELLQLQESGKLPPEALLPLTIIASRFERVGDQACNICEEVLFMCTGEDIKHRGVEQFRILFVDEADACRAQMAVGIGKSLGLQRFLFNSAGISPRPVDPRTIEFMASKGIDISNQTSKYLNQIPDLEAYEVIIALCKEAQVAFPPPPTKTVSIPWHIDDPSRVKGSEDEIRAAYERTYDYLYTHISDLVNAVLGNDKTEGH